VKRCTVEHLTFTR